MQIIDTKKIKPNNGTGGDRYRIVLSDGVTFMSGMLATQLAFVRERVAWPSHAWTSGLTHDCVTLQMMENESLQVNYVMQLKDYLVNEVQGRR